MSATDTYIINPGAPNPVRSPRPATPVTLTAIQLAWAKFALRVHQLRPSELRAQASPAALQQRILETDALIIAMADVLRATVEDTARSCHCSRRPDDIVDSYMTDLGGELRGLFLRTLDEVAA